MIPLCRPYLDEADVQAVSTVLRSGQLVMGPQVEAFERELAARCNRAHCIAVSSGTAALALALEAMEVGPGDSVVCPALTWPSPAHAAARLGAEVRLADVELDHWNCASVQSLCDESTRVVIAIDQFGNPAPVLEIPSSASLLEDAACAIGSLFEDGSPCGSRGLISCLSFHPRKVLTTGEGGACLTDDEELATRLRVLRNHGQREPGVFEGPGPNTRLTEMGGALGRHQLAKLDDMLARRRELALSMRNKLEGKLQLQRELGQSSFQTLGALLPAEVERDGFIARCRELGAQVGRLSYSVGQLGTIEGDHQTPNADEIARRGVALPLFFAMTEAQADEVCAIVEQALS